MSSKGPLAYVSQLKERARKGDGAAIDELRKLRAVGSQLKRQAMQVAAESAAEEVAGEEDDEDIIAAEGSPDKLEQADWVARKYADADGLVQKVALRNMGWTGLNDVAKFARINPPSVMQGTLGGQQIVRSDNVAPIEVCNWSGADEETVPITVTIAPVEQIRIGNAALSDVRPFAIVQFGTRGFSVKAEVDIGKGRQFTISGSSCIVQVGLDNPLGAVTSMKLAGMLSFYPVVRTAPLYRTVYVENVGAGSSQVFPVPPFAVNVLPLFFDNVVGPPPAQGPYQLYFEDSSTSVRYSRYVPAGAPLTTPIPLSDDITQIEVRAQFGVDVSGRLVFELAL